MSHFLERSEEAKARAELAKKLRKAEAEERRKAIRERGKIKGLQIRPTASYFDEAEQKEPGEGNWSRFGFDLNPQVTGASTLILILFIVLMTESVATSRT